MTPTSASFSLKVVADRDAVEHRVDRDAGQGRALLQRDAELLVGRQQFGIDLVEDFGPGWVLGGGIVGGSLVVDRRDVELRPVRLFHLLPAPEGLQPPVQQPVRLLLLGRDEADGVFVEARGRLIGLDIGDEAVFVAFVCRGLDNFESVEACCHCKTAPFAVAR